MSMYRLDTAKLDAAINQARGAGTPDEISVREVARRTGLHPSLFARLRARSSRPDADALVSILMWLNPDARISDFAEVGERRRAKS